LTRNSKSKLQRLAGVTQSDRQALLGVVFADISDSTELLHDLGTERMEKVRSAFFVQGEALSEQFDGYVVKPLGDGLFVAFPTAIHAFDFTRALSESPGNELIVIHAGIDVGPVLIDVERNDIHGDPVNYAARLESVARPNEIVVSDSVKSHLDALRAERHDGLQWTKRIRRFKGFKKPRPTWSVECHLGLQ